jgi:hypothetical protein
MPLDPSISLGIKPPDIAGNMAQWGNLGLLRNQLQISNATVEPTIAQRIAESQLQQTAAARSAGTLEADIAGAKARTAIEQTAAQRAAYQLPQDMADRAFQEAGPLSRDPRIVRLAAKDQNGQPLPISNNEITAASEAIAEAKDRMITGNVPRAHAELAASPLLAQLIRDPSQVPNMLANINLAGQNRQTQAAAMAPSYTAVPTQGGTQFPQTNTYAPGGVTGLPPAGGALPPPNTAVTMPGSGNPGRMNVATGKIEAATEGPVGGAPPQAAGGQPSQMIPAGMTPETYKGIIAEGQAAATRAQSAGGVHGVNDQIWTLASQATTSKVGQAASNIRRWLPTPIATMLGIDENTSTAVATDKLTKYLAQQNLRMAQTMGIRTDQQTEQVAQAGGEQHYAPEALKSIVNTNDGFIKGDQLFAQGYNNVLQKRGPQAAAEFKIQFGNIFDADTGALLHLMESGNKARITDFFATHGGKGSDEMLVLGEKATILRRFVRTGVMPQ